MEKTPENKFILFIFHLNMFWRGEKKEKLTADAALRY